MDTPKCSTLIMEYLHSTDFNLNMIATHLEMFQDT